MKNVKHVFESGAVRDVSAEKGRMDLLPHYAILKVARHCERGSIHYGEHNVDKGIPISSLCSSGMRHLMQYLDGKDNEDHLTAAVWNLLWAVQMERDEKMINIPNRVGKDTFPYSVETKSAN